MALLKPGKTSHSLTPGTTQTPQRATEKIHGAEIDYYARREQGRSLIETLLLDVIDLDPTNPRTKGINPRPLLAVVPPFLVIDPKETAYDKDKVAVFDNTIANEIAKICEDAERGAYWKGFFEDLMPLRDNIRLIGVKQAIEVRRKGKRYEIVFGHRRYLASILAGERNIIAHVIAEDAKGTKHIQVSENLHQKRLTLAQSLESIELALADIGLTSSSKAIEAASLLGLERTRMQRSMRVLAHGSPALRAAINAGVVTDLKQASDYAGLTDDAVTAALAATGESTNLKTVQRGTKGKEGGRGPRKKFILTPKITNTGVIAEILKKFDYQVPTAFDWKKPKDVNVVWNEFIKKLEEQCQRVG